MINVNKNPSPDFADLLIEAIDEALQPDQVEKTHQVAYESMPKLNTAVKQKDLKNSFSKENYRQNEELMAEFEKARKALELANLKIKELEVRKAPEKVNDFSSQEPYREIEHLKAELAKAQQQADTLLKRSGQNHIKRDWERLKGGAIFPNGAEIKEEITATFLNFESFACDINTCFEMHLNVPENESSKMLIRDVLKPLYDNCKEFVNKTIELKKNQLKAFHSTAIENQKQENHLNSVFWYAHMQPQLNELTTLSEEQIQELLMNGGRIQEVHETMLKAAANGEIPNDANDLRIPQVAQYLVRFMMIAELSDPPCYVYPAPETRLSYKTNPDNTSTQMKEILSPGAKKYGLIRNGDPVEVVFPGLYWTNPESNPEALAIIPMLVRRINCKLLTEGSQDRF